MLFGYSFFYVIVLTAKVNAEKRMVGWLNHEIYEIWEEEVVVGICLEGLSKVIKNLS
jgi:hypothetical protein